MTEYPSANSSPPPSLSLVLRPPLDPEGLQASLEALARQLGAGDELLWLGDAAPPLAGLSLRALACPAGAPWGQAAALARQQAQGQVLVFLELPALPCPSLLEDLRQAFADPALSAVAGLLRGRDARSLLARLAQLEAEWLAERADWPSAQCLALRRADMAADLAPRTTPAQLWRAWEQEGKHLYHDPELFLERPLPQGWGGLWRLAQTQGRGLRQGPRPPLAALQMLLSLLAPALFLGFWTWAPDRAVTLGLLCLLLHYPINRGFLNFVAQEEPGALWPGLAYCLLRPWGWLAGLLKGPPPFRS